MRKILLTALLVAGGLTASAQYLQNEGFKYWKKECGKTDQTSKYKKNVNAPAGFLQPRPGTEPCYWNGSNVYQTVVVPLLGYASVPAQSSKLVTTSMRGDSEVVMLKNVKMGVSKYTSNAPAFINFATPWVYAVSDVDACDGVVYGDTTFTYKPDAIKGVFKRTQGNAPENAHIIAYFWTGTFKSPIAQTGSDGNKSTRIQADVDRAVMGRPDAGTITGDGQLIASCDYAFATTKYYVWEEIIVPIEY